MTPWHDVSRNPFAVCSVALHDIHDSDTKYPVNRRALQRLEGKIVEIIIKVRQHAISPAVHAKSSAPCEKPAVECMQYHRCHSTGHGSLIQWIFEEFRT